MEFMIRGRRNGKTSALLEWVRQGEQIDSYPFWSRIILTINQQEADRLRRSHGIDYRQVFSVQEWRTAHIGRKTVEVAIDNADIVLRELAGGHKLVQVTATGEVV